ANKYPAGALMIGVAVAHLEARWREGRSLWRVFRDIRPWVAAYAAIVAFLCGTPYFVLDWQQTVKDFEYQRGFIERGVGNELAGWGWPWLFLKVMPDSFGLLLMALLLAGLVWAVVRPRLGTLSLFAFILVAFVGMTSSRYTFYRYVLVPLPALVLLAGRLVGDAYAWLSTVVRPVRAGVVTAAL